MDAVHHVSLADDCFICRKHAGMEAQPPGGYFLADAHWRVCHAPIKMGVAGTLIVESQRHYLDFADMTDDEAASLGALLRSLYAALKQVTGAERVYTLATMEGAAHLHVWLAPRQPDAQTRALAFLASDASCSEEAALATVLALRAILR
ncbi:MAG TPA: hypothetical protein VMV29_07575 [Ktedonobacterales bacterium]|nr:hypothetical protein [Ktedonobacterales bacterium]